EILDEARRGVRVEMRDERTVTHADLSLFEHGRHRHDDREFFRIAFEVVRHRDDGLVLVPHENDLRGLIEELRVGLRDVEAAERQDGRRRDRHQDEAQSGNADHAFHDDLLAWRSWVKLRARRGGAESATEAYSLYAAGRPTTRQRSIATPLGPWRRA